MEIVERIDGVEAARRILKGKKLKNCYIESLTTDNLEIMNNIMEDEGSLQSGESISVINIGTESSPNRKTVLLKPVFIESCQIGFFNLSNFVFDKRFQLLYCVIENNCRIESLIFKNRALFFETQFPDRSFIQDIKCNKLDLSHSTHLGTTMLNLGGISYSEICFYRSIFHGDLHIKNAALESLNFEYAEFKKSCNINCAKPNRINFSYATIALNLSIKVYNKREKSNRSGVLVLTDTLVQGTFLCDFAFLNPKNDYFKICSLDNDTRRSFIWLKEQYRKIGAYQDEDDAHWYASYYETISYKRVKSESRLIIISSIIATFLLFGLVFKLCYTELNNSFIELLPFFIFSFLGYLLWELPYLSRKLILEKIFGYGVRIKNISVSIAFVIFIFALLFFTSDSIANRDVFDSKFLNALYFSTITFETVGYGDITPKGFAASLAMIEGLIGVAFNAALIVVIFRKIIR